MSVLCKNGDYIILDHRSYTAGLYKDVVQNDSKKCTYALAAKLFKIVNNKKNVNRKRTHDYEILLKETKAVEQIYEKMLKEISDSIKNHILSNCMLLNENVREHAQNLFQSTIFDHAGLRGGNNSDKPLKCKIKEEYFLMPNNARFLCGCVKEQCKNLAGNKYDIMIADPPWWNKYIRRLKGANSKLSYSMMYNEDIADIPVEQLFSSNCLIAVWCTNAQSNVAAVKNLIFPKWGVEYVATWYWLKITINLEPVCNFGTGCKKQPYERIMLGKVGEVKDVPDGQLIISVPSALHSHKPPLLDLLSPYVSVENPNILELFARYLLPNTTSVGYEPLKWQHISLYDDIK